MMPKPSKGRIVLFVLPDGNLKGTTRPAIVTVTAADNGWESADGVSGYKPEDEVVQLHVFLDGRNDAQHGYQPWYTSVKHDEGKAPGTWHWPPRVA